MLRSGQFNFSKGEIAEELVARVDVASYSAALRTARNVVILKYGGVAKRPGTRLVAEALDASEPVRLIPFQYSLLQSYALEMGRGYMRPAALGGQVLEELLTVEGLTKAVNAEVHISNHGYVVDDPIYFQNVAGMTQINGRKGKVVTVIDADHFTIDIDTRNFGTFTGDSGGIVRVIAAPPPTPPPSPTPVVPTPSVPSVGGSGYYQDRDVRNAPSFFGHIP